MIDFYGKVILIKPLEHLSLLRVYNVERHEDSYIFGRFREYVLYEKNKPLIRVSKDEIKEHFLWVVKLAEEK
jgi:hypothetical protein